MACLNARGSCAGGTVDVESVTEASLRVVTCSGALKLGKIKASSVDVDTAGESHLYQGTLCTQVSDAPNPCIRVAVGFWGVGGGGAHGFMPVWAPPC